MDKTILPEGYFDVLDARNPYWSDEAQKSITLEVLFSWGGENTTYIPFTASRADSEAHGRALFTNAQAGQYGTVQPAPKPTTEAVQAQMAMRIREATRVLHSLTVELETLEDSVTFGMDRRDTQAQISAIRSALQGWKKYRVEVSTVPAQADYPHAVIWPIPPSEDVLNKGGYE